MPYQGSYIWKIRQQIGHDSLLMPSADAIAVRDDGKLMLVLNKDWNNWFFPGGYAEEGQTSDECAARELLEEAGLDASPSELVPFAFASGHAAVYPNSDVTYPFTQLFIARTWRDSGLQLDGSEVSERRWFSLDELDGLDLRPYTKRVIGAYREYIKSGVYQMINLRKE